MAHKKSGGSTRNGRDSQGQRRGVKIFGGQKYEPETSLCASWGHGFTRGETSEWAGIIPCLLKSMVWCITEGLADRGKR